MRSSRVLKSKPAILLTLSLYLSGCASSDQRDVASGSLHETLQAFAESKQVPR